MLHGGDVYTEGIYKGMELLDFSSNINPLGLPESFKKNISKALVNLERYPDIQYREVFTSLKKYTGLEEECFVLGNGAVEVIDLAVSLFNNLLIAAPSFIEYELSALKKNSKIQYSFLNEDMDFDYTDISEKLHYSEAIIIGNPNNPSGNIINKAKFRDILDYCEEQGKVIIIDEAFIEFTGDKNHSFAEEIKNYSCLFIIRALTKFFAMPGVRFGYGISSNKVLIKQIRAKQNPWNINSFAELAAVHVLQDKEYIKNSLLWIEEERPFLTGGLKDIAFIKKVYPTKANFVLCVLKDLEDESLYRYLLEKRIILRQCHSFKGLDSSFIRLAIKDRVSNERLLKALKDIEVSKWKV